MRPMPKGDPRARRRPTYTDRTRALRALAAGIAGRRDRGRRVGLVASGLVAATAVAAMVYAARALTGHPHRPLLWIALPSGLTMATALLLSLRRRTSLFAAVKLADDALGLHDLLSSALAFDSREQPASSPTRSSGGKPAGGGPPEIASDEGVREGPPLQDAEAIAIAAGEDKAPSVRAAEVVPRAPLPQRRLVGAGLLAGAAVALFLLGPPGRRPDVATGPKQTAGAVAAERKDIDRLLAEVNALRKAADAVHLDDPAKRELGAMADQLRNLKARLPGADKAQVMATLTQMESDLEKRAAEELERAMAKGRMADAAAAARKLSDALARHALTPESMRSAASALARASERAGAQTSLGRSLGEASRALDRGREDDARRALDRASSELASDASAAVSAAISRRVLDALRRDVDATKGRMGREGADGEDEPDFASDESEPAPGAGSDPEGSGASAGGEKTHEVCTPLPDGGVHCEKMSSVGRMGSTAVRGSGSSEKPGGERGGLTETATSGAATAELERLIRGAGGGHPLSGLDPGHDWETQAPVTPQSATSASRDNAIQVGSASAISQVEAAGTGKPESLAARGYVRTLLEYEKIAEDEMYGEDIPPERRPYVRTYFESIRPGTDVPPAPASAPTP